MKKAKRLIASVLAVIMIFSCFITASAEDSAITYSSGNYTAKKITNPTAGSGEPDGLLYGEEANRINSYAWSTAYRDGYLYIGVNRNFLNVALSTFGTGISTEVLNELESVLTQGELPAFNKDERQAMILKLNPETGETKIIYRPPYLEQYDVYLDAAYRNVIEYKGDLYYGSMGAVTTRILKVDKDDNVTVAFSGGAGASFRSSEVYNDELYFAGFDTRITDNVKEDGTQYTKMAIIRMEGEEWNRVADHKDFIEYAEDTIYQGEGGNMWDIIAYNGYLYAIIATSNGFVMFKGIEDPENENANEYGWVWEEVIGKNSEYNCGLAPTAEGYPFSGAVASTATPVVYNGKLYIGTFDYATQSLAAIIKRLVNYINGNLPDLKLSQLLAPMYYSLTYQQKLYEMDENGVITEVEEFNKLMEGTANEYIWRFQEHDGKLYISTFDAETMYKYITQLADGFLVSTDMSTLVSSLSSIMSLLEEITSDDEEEVSSGAEEASEEDSDILDKVTNLIDMKGINMYLEMAQILADNTAGFDLYVTEDMENFELISDNGFNDEYNYGARTFASTEDGLYIGTANPFYGAQVWLLNETEEAPVGEDVSYSLNVTEGTVSAAYAGTTVATLAKKMPSSDILDITVTDAEGTVLDSKATLTTGDIVKCSTTITLTTHTVFEYAIAVLGDTDCDGKVSASDARIALRIAAGIEQASNAVREAADVDFDNKVTAADARMILRSTANIEKLKIS